MSYIVTKRKPLLMSYLVFVAISVLCIVFIDVGYLWLSLILIPSLSVLAFAYYEKITSNKRLFDVIRISSLSLVLVTTIFVVMNLFVTNLWWFGFTIPIYLLLQHIYLFKDIALPSLTNKDKKIMIYSLASVFIVMLVFYIVPSYVANNSSNPKPRFNNETYPVESYTLYFDTIDNDLINREHVVAKSWYSNDFNYVNDYVNVIRAFRHANTSRSNLIFKDVSKNNATKVENSLGLIGYLTNDYFMPLDQYKGDIARIILYMYVTYKDDGLVLDYIDIGLMKKWSRLDPVDQKEKDRNNLIQQTYGYNNKFVSMPWLIGFIV